MLMVWHGNSLFLFIMNFPLNYSTASLRVHSQSQCKQWQPRPSISGKRLGFKADMLNIKAPICSRGWHVVFKTYLRLFIKCRRRPFNKQRLLSFTSLLDAIILPKKKKKNLHMTWKWGDCAAVTLPPRLTQSYLLICLDCLNNLRECAFMPPQPSINRQRLFVARWCNLFPLCLFHLSHSKLDSSWDKSGLLGSN